MKFLNREDGSYGPIPSRRPLGMLGMPMNTTSIKGLYCVGDSTFPGQVGFIYLCMHILLCVHWHLLDLPCRQYINLEYISAVEFLFVANLSFATCSVIQITITCFSISIFSNCQMG